MADGNYSNFIFCTVSRNKNIACYCTTVYNLLHRSTHTHLFSTKALRFQVTVLIASVFLQTVFLRSEKCTSVKSLAPKQ